jgi:cell wall-associated NlpC family hydrolase
MKKQVNYVFIILSFMMVACSQPNGDEILELVLEIQQNQIPDKRLEFWDVAVTIEAGKTSLNGATVSEKAFRKLQNLASEKALDFNVELLPGKTFKENPWGIVTLSVCNIRGDRTHSSELITQALMGSPVKVFTKVDEWYLVQTPDRYFGWTDDAGIALKTNSELAEWKTLDKVLYNNQSGFGYSKADAESLVETDLILADLLSITSSEKDFYKIILADGREAFVKKNECISLDNWKAKNLSVDKVLEAAYNFKGIPYLWGGSSSKMTDCSGFVKTAYYLNGILLQRDASQQTLYGELVDTENDYDKLQAGDLVFFGRKASSDTKERVTHVGLCMGDTKFIHASGKVRINSLDRESEIYTEHYENAFVRARRIVENIDGAGIEWVVDNEFYKEVLPE